MRVVVVGGTGQLGHDVVRAFTNCGDEVVSMTHADIELSDFSSVENALHKHAPGFVVNTAAMHHVEKCEQEADRAYAVNVTGSLNLAKVTEDLGAVLAHVSTDYVFDGKKGTPYLESDEPRPLNVYGKTKLQGEEVVRSTNPKHFVLRTAALYGTHPCRAKGGQNFVDLMLRLGRERGQVRVVAHEFTTPTATTDLAQQILRLSRSDSYGLYHATAEGSCSWYEFASEIFERAGLNVRLEVASPGEFPLKVPRPFYSVLENHALKSQSLNAFRPWQVALQEYLSTKRQEVTTPA